MTGTSSSHDRGHDPGLYGRSFADVYDAWYAQLHDIDSIVAAIGRRLDPGDTTILELGSGTGRLTEPLADLDHDLIALDASLEMLGLDPSDSMRVGGDMAALPLADTTVDAAVIAYNTFFSLSDRSLQNRCLREVARVLRPGGWLVIESFIAPPPDPETPFGISMIGHHSDTDRRLAILTWQGPGDEVITGAHIELGPDGSRTRPWQIVYRTPSDIDDAAMSAGLELIARHADWDGTPLPDDAVRHVSWYQPIAAA